MSAPIILAITWPWAHLSFYNCEKSKPTCQKGHLEGCSHCREPTDSSFAPRKIEAVYELKNHMTARKNIHEIL